MNKGKDVKIDRISEEDVELPLLASVPLSYARGNMLMPLRRENGDFLVGAVSGQEGVFALFDLAREMSLKPKALWGDKAVVLEAINRYYGQLGSAKEVMADIREDDLSSVATEFERPKDILELTEEAPIIRLLNALLKQAMKDRASDIHIEPFEKELEVRIRVDGVLKKILAPPKIIQDALVSRVKIMASLDIAERRLPQDGRIRLLVGGKDIDIRVSLIPTIHGERVVMRLLDRRGGSIGLTDLGMDEAMREQFDGLLSRQNGIILVTGPTGSGKTTTLYAALRKIFSEEKNIVTIEDPVEYELSGIGQIQINPKVGLTFASGLRSILRQDPDVIMVGEIRDLETAQIAIQASLTGHLVLSTLHTNDAASAITRLIDIGVEPFLVASSLAGVLAQRLVRRNCSYCSAPYESAPSGAALAPDALIMQNALLAQNKDAAGIKASRGRGCERCGGSGYLGRAGIFEFLDVVPSIRKLITERADAKSIAEKAISEGMRTLRMDGLLKVSTGLTTPEEVFRVTQQDDAGFQV
ncbi:MAG: type II secretion system ATPase GspE [Nitrospiraceae bacterium]|nr:type II secretion system ATPase GspE [Nitrospiraceae bacterium]